MKNQQNLQKSPDYLNRHRLTALLPFLAVFIILIATNPYKIPLALIPIPFGLVAFGVYRLVLFGAQVLGLDTKKSRILAMLASGSSTLALILKSIGQLSPRDFIILMLLTLGLVFYINRASLSTK